MVNDLLDPGRRALIPVLRDKGVIFQNAICLRLEIIKCLPNGPVFSVVQAINPVRDHAWASGSSLRESLLRTYSAFKAIP